MTVYKLAKTHPDWQAFATIVDGEVRVWRVRING
jgi:hypothetical protein